MANYQVIPSMINIPAVILKYVYHLMNQEGNWGSMELRAVFNQMVRGIRKTAAFLTKFILALQRELQPVPPNNNTTEIIPRQGNNPGEDSFFYRDVTPRPKREWSVNIEDFGIKAPDQDWSSWLMIDKKE